MKRILLPAALALALAGGFAVAQQAVEHGTQAGHHHRGERAHDPHKAALKISRKLNLSADQTARLEPIFVEREQKVAALRANTALSPEDRKEQFRAIHEDSRKQLGALLTPQQLEQMKAMHHDHGRKGEEKEHATS